VKGANDINLNKELKDTYYDTDPSTQSILDQQFQGIDFGKKALLTLADML
jgi:hypothetical protein